MVGKPDVYLLDEITSALDEENSKIVMSAVIKENAIVINVSHKEKMELGLPYDSVYCLDKGKIYIEQN